jgi:hypothetical protein
MSAFAPNVVKMRSVAMGHYRTSGRDLTYLGMLPVPIDHKGAPRGCSLEDGLSESANGGWKQCENAGHPHWGASRYFDLDTIIRFFLVYG